MGWDSLDAVEYAMLLEEEFDIIISDQEAENLESIKDVYALVRLKILK